MVLTFVKSQTSSHRPSLGTGSPNSMRSDDPYRTLVFVIESGVDALNRLAGLGSRPGDF